jgi:hypothetical protein
MASTEPTPLEFVRHGVEGSIPAARLALARRRRRAAVLLLLFLAGAGGAWLVAGGGQDSAISVQGLSSVATVSATY